MSRVVAVVLAVAVAGLWAAVPVGAAPFGFTDPARAGAAPVVIDVAAAGPAGTGVVAWLDVAAEMHAVRIAANGAVGADHTLARGQSSARGLQAVVTDRGEIAVVWSSLSGDRNEVLQIAASATGAWGSLHTLGVVGSYTAATPQLAALTGGTVAAIWRDRRTPSGNDTLRYARRAPGRMFGAGRSLGHDGLYPDVAAVADGGALLSWQRGPAGRQVAAIARARRGAPRPGVAHDVAGHLRFAAPLFAAADGAVAISWIRAESAGTSTLHTRALAPSIGAVRDVDAQVSPSAAAELAVGAGSTSIAAWGGWQPASGGYRVFAAGVVKLDPWGTPVALHAKGTRDDGQPQPVILHGGGALVAWAKSRDEVNGLMYDAAIGRAGAPTPDEPQTLGPTVGHRGGGRLVRGDVRLVRGGGRLIAAWPDPVVGVRIATRPA